MPTHQSHGSLPSKQATMRMLSLKAHVIGLTAMHAGPNVDMRMMESRSMLGLQSMESAPLLLSWKKADSTQIAHNACTTPYPLSIGRQNIALQKREHPPSEPVTTHTLSLDVHVVDLTMHAGPNVDRFHVAVVVVVDLGCRSRL
jgi:hypothetical protein